MSDSQISKGSEKNGKTRKNRFKAFANLFKRKNRNEPKERAEQMPDMEEMAFGDKEMVADQSNQKIVKKSKRDKPQ